MEKIRVLQVVGSLELGGLQTTVMNIIRNAPEQYQFDILVCGPRKGEFEKEAKALGCQILCCKEPAKDLISFIRLCIHLFSGENRYHIVHSHIYLASGIVLFLAKVCKVPVRIAHIHSVKRSTEGSIRIKFKNDILRYFLRRNATVYCACSVKAGTDAFGKRHFQKSGIVFPNFIKTQNFIFNEKERTKSREKYGISEKQFVVGQVANFTDEKNQVFLIRTFRRYIQKYDNQAILVLVGDGKNRNLIEDAIAAAHMEKNIILTGRLVEVETIYPVFDVLAVSSYNEGFCMALLEAEINGLPFVIEKNALVDELRTFGKGIVKEGFREEEWCDAIQEAKKIGRYDQTRADRMFKRYDIRYLKAFIQDLYSR
jgi:glycosyltransferase involved in cell wall biosynthesis